MPDLLGVTNPVPGYDKAINNRTTTQVPVHNPQLQNVPDLTKVIGADRRTEQQQANLQQNGKIRYDSNFQTFLERLTQASDVTQTLSGLFSGRMGTVVLSGIQEGIALEMSKIIQMMQMDETQMKAFLIGQAKSGNAFSGKLCNLLRSLYARTDSQNIRTDILLFLKSYGDFSGANHIGRNILSGLQEMTGAIPEKWANQLRSMVLQLHEHMSRGDRAAALELMQKGIFPYMARYIEQTHDMGLPRDLLSRFALNIVRYENGTEEKLIELFHQLKNYPSLKNQLQFLTDDVLLKIIHSEHQNQSQAAAHFADSMIQVADKALNGQGSQQIQEGFQNFIASMLLNESVYMPLNHYVVPLQWNGQMMFSEIWVDPDAEHKKGDTASDPENNIRQFLIKVDVESLGLFDIVIVNQRSDVNIQIACPEKISGFADKIEKAVSEILIRNSLNPVGVTAFQMKRPVTITEVFPHIFQGGGGVNVKA